MSIKLPSATLNEPFEYISLRDDALDSEAEGFAEDFQRYREGTIQAPPLKEGYTPTRFHLQPIADADLKAKLNGLRESSRAEWFTGLARYAIVGIEGAPKELGAIIRERDADGFSVLSKRQSNLLSEYLEEIGMVVATHDLPSGG